MGDMVVIGTFGGMVLPPVETLKTENANSDGRFLNAKAQSRRRKGMAV